MSSQKLLIAMLLLCFSLVGCEATVKTVKMVDDWVQEHLW